MSDEPEAGTKPYAIEYNHKGYTWGFELFAEDEEDARRKLKSIGTNGRVIGELGKDVRKVKLPGWFADLLLRIGILERRK